jgi:hypothetical protein
MSLSEHEKKQFELLTADLTLDDPSVLKMMAKKDRLTEMSYMPLPSPRATLMTLVVMSACVFVGSILTHNLILFNANCMLCVLLMVVVLFSPADKFMAAKRKTAASE